MKTNLKTLFIIPLILALAAGPVWAQPDAPAAPPPTPVATPEAQSGTNADQSPKTVSIPDASRPKQTENGPRLARVGEFDPSGPHTQEIVAIVSGILLAFLLPVTLLAVFLYFHQRRNAMLHETLRAMVEKGVPIPAELLPAREQSIPRQRGNDLRRGLLLAGVGLGLLMVALAEHGPKKLGLAGFIPLFIGIAFLISWKVEQPKKDETNQ